MCNLKYGGHLADKKEDLLRYQPPPTHTHTHHTHIHCLCHMICFCCVYRVCFDPTLIFPTTYEPSRLTTVLLTLPMCTYSMYKFSPLIIISHNSIIVSSIFNLTVLALGFTVISRNNYMQYMPTTYFACPQAYQVTAVQTFC